ncbi:hypothetical protein [Phenylobacterium sp.]|uniref:hypothetical protein n=1 Tax=Phenylobacterium sp. TaxID=1871053 RepID=UPI0025DFB6DB|nr:hypothetical protein [Phenylobacterium sp.]MBX3482532.1 hypothetical protein [Phenylobacterium sp.]MCW5759244.1 hypothetical protein [Phenylobacterium sp.]
MARLSITLTLETADAHDAIADLGRVLEALRGRHGDAFRVLERKLHRIIDGEIAVSPPGVHHLGEGIFTYALPAELSECLAEARRLGVIR